MVAILSQPQYVNLVVSKAILQAHCEAGFPTLKKQTCSSPDFPCVLKHLPPTPVEPVRCIYWCPGRPCLSTRCLGNLLLTEVNWTDHWIYRVYEYMIWAWSPMPGEKQALRDSVNKNQGWSQFLSTESLEPCFSQDIMMTMIASYHSPLTDLFSILFTEI